MEKRVDKEKNNRQNENDQLIADILKSHDKIHKEKPETAAASSNSAVQPEQAVQKQKPVPKKLKEEIGLAEPPVNTDGLEEAEEWEEEPPRRTRKKKKKKRWFLLILALVIISVAVFCSVIVISIGKDMMGFETDETSVDVVIPSGATTSDIAEILKESGVVEYPMVFRLISRLQEADSLYKDGTHTLRMNMAYETIIEELQTESVKDTLDLTFPEGYHLNQCARILEENEICSAEEFLKVFNTVSFGYDFEKSLTDNPERFYAREGYFFPDTYRFKKGTDPEAVAKKIYANFSEKMTPDLLGRMSDLGISLEDTITLASIVQAEAPEMDEMKNVASVFWNRISDSDDFPRLESDPTKKYAENVIRENSEAPDEDMIEAYNTYAGKGLPPGPICNPGLEAIEAVLYPSETPYYYFCSNLSTREFFYAETLAEHEQNLVKAGLR